MDGAGDGVGLRGDDAGGVDLLAVGPHPGLPQAGEAHGLAVGAAAQIGLRARRLARAGAVPLVERVGRHQAAPPAQRVAEAGLLGQPLRPGIEDQRERLGILDEPGQEGPARQREVPDDPTLLARRAHDRDRLRRRDVVACREVRLLDIGEQRAHGLRRQGDGEASAHVALRERRGRLRDTPAQSVCLTRFPNVFFTAPAVQRHRTSSRALFA